MAPKRAQTNPAPKTEAARAQLSTFHCTLCNKGYARANEFAAHEASYEHNHAQRRKDLNSMNMKFAKNTSSSKGEDGVMKSKPISFGLKKKDGEGGGGGFKKAGFKSAFAKVEAVEESKEEVKVASKDADARAVQAKAPSAQSGVVDVEMKSDDDDDVDRYDPKRPTGCEKCNCRAPRLEASSG